MSHLIINRTDVTPQLTEATWEIVAKGDLDSPIAWDDVFAELQEAGWDFGEDRDTPAVRQLVRVTRRRVREGRAETTYEPHPHLQEPARALGAVLDDIERAARES